MTLEKKVPTFILLHKLLLKHNYFKNIYKKDCVPTIFTARYKNLI